MIALPFLNQLSLPFFLFPIFPSYTELHLAKQLRIFHYYVFRINPTPHPKKARAPAVRETAGALLN
jgi:hypothetical protein